ncbi:MAG: hypothetical protein JNK25_07645 [Phycisphaerae bacterium]|nr:hypothetical protein [Phycisphaerae bacterium]
MRHRHLHTRGWTVMGIESLFERGSLADWREFYGALRTDEALARRSLDIARRHADRGSAMLAVSIIARLYPALGDEADAALRGDPRAFLEPLV